MILTQNGSPFQTKADFIDKNLTDTQNIQIC